MKFFYTNKIEFGVQSIPNRAFDVLYVKQSENCNENV